jgi:dihydroorotase
MPNQRKGLMNAGAVTAHVAHAQSAVPEGISVQFVGFLQITEKTTERAIDECVAAGIMDAKVYPKGRTTESHNGVAHYEEIFHLVRHAGKVGMRVHFHPEHPSELFDNRDAEWMFLPLMDIFIHETEDTGTVLIWEHGTDARCIPHWEVWAKTGRFFVTITAHHLLDNESSAYGDVRSTYKPPAKREEDRRGLFALIAKADQREYSWVMAGGDDAPHPTWEKHRLGQCACGAYTAPFLLQLYAHALLPYVSVEAFICFINRNAAALYGWEDTGERLNLFKKPFTIPKTYLAGFWMVESFWALRTIEYSIE